MEELKEISNIIHRIKKEEDIYNFLLEMLTESEIGTLSKRWRILKMLYKGETQRDISKELNVSLCKVTRGAKIIRNKNAIVTKYIDKGEYNNENTDK